MTKKIFASISAFILLGYVKSAMAASNDPRQGLELGAQNAGYNTMSKPSFQSVLMVIVKYALGFIGLVFVVLILYGGYQWMTSGGSDDKIKKAKDTILHAAIGLAIIFIAYAITWLVADVMSKATGPGYWSYN